MIADNFCLLIFLNILSSRHGSVVSDDMSVKLVSESFISELGHNISDKVVCVHGKDSDQPVNTKGPECFNYMMAIEHQ